MFDIDFKTEDGTEDNTEYELTILAVYSDDPNDSGFEMAINDICPWPTARHLEEIQSEWREHGGLYERAADMAYLEREEHQC